MAPPDIFTAVDFGIKDDASLLKFLEDLKARPDMKKSGRLFETGVLWDPILGWLRSVAA